MEAKEVKETGKGVLAYYISGFINFNQGEKISTILYFLLPELISVFLLYSLPVWFDAALISTLKSTSLYTTLGVTNNFLHFMTKIAEAFGVGTIVLSGQLNGSSDYKQVGRSLRDSFWVTSILGSVIAAILYCSSYWIYNLYGMSPDIIELGVPFLKIRALGVFFMFIYFALAGFLRGIKNTKAPMYIFCVGIALFLFFDYVLIFGHLGFPQMGLQGSALATVIQYGAMLVLTCIYIATNKEYKKYTISLFEPIKDGTLAFQLIKLSMPVMLDKAIMAIAYIWLCKMIGCMGTSGLATFCAIKDMERFASLPALAAAQVITFLVSNDFGAEQWDSIKNNIKKMLCITAVGSLSILTFFIIFAQQIAYIFDKTGDFSYLIISIFPILGILAFFDLFQIVLAGALRGSGNVKTVMYARLIICFGYFIPVSYMISLLPIENFVLKFILIYGSYYVGTAFMAYIYINHFKGETWKQNNYFIKN